MARRRISDWIPIAALAGGIALQAWQNGWRGAMWAVLGAATGFAVFFVRYWLFNMGGGDVKLMAGFGAILGVQKILWATLWSAAFGGIWALVVIGAVAVWNRLRRRPDAARPETIPYAPAITLGVLIALVPAN
jgi:prepilin peptidase CpaA